jgi:hypothetical protein
MIAPTLMAVASNKPKVGLRCGCSALFSLIWTPIRKLF